MNYKIGIREFEPVGRLGLADEIILTCKSYVFPHTRRCSMCKRMQYVTGEKCADCMNTPNLNHFSPDPWLVDSDLLFRQFCIENGVNQQFEEWKFNYYKGNVPVVYVDEYGIKRLKR